MAGDHIYPTAERFEFLLPAIFQLVLADGKLGWCERTYEGTRLWVFVSDAISQAGVEEQAGPEGNSATSFS